MGSQPPPLIPSPSPASGARLAGTGESDMGYFCQACRGWGVKSRQTQETCVACGGSGFRKEAPHGIIKHTQRRIPMLHNQRGMFLAEALVSLLLLSIGVLAMLAAADFG